jgi:hypothetical protein
MLELDVQSRQFVYLKMIDHEPIASTKYSDKIESLHLMHVELTPIGPENRLQSASQLGMRVPGFEQRPEMHILCRVER